MSNPVSKYSFVGAVAAVLLAGLPQISVAQTAVTPTSDWAPAAVDHARRMAVYDRLDASTQQTPPAIPKVRVDADPSGQIATFQPGGATLTANNAFFQTFGSNGRTCFTCHQPQEGWSFSAAGAKARFDKTAGLDPLFRLVDGATCPTATVTTLEDKRNAYKLATDKALIRLGLSMPARPILQFEVSAVDDPYNCNTNPSTGLRSPTSGIVSVYRRTLPSANVGFLPQIMWDGREPDLEAQANNAAKIHAQAPFPMALDARAQIADFQRGIFTAQVTDTEARELYTSGAAGGPGLLARVIPRLFPGINDPFGPNKARFTPNVFNLYKPWSGSTGQDSKTLKRLSIARGEQVFDTLKFDIKDVAGLNDVQQTAVVQGTCSTCHNTPVIGNASVASSFMALGAADAGAKASSALDITGLPVFTLKCTAGPLAGQTFEVTDPGRALITGRCADIGKTKIPILRGLAARAPYFHNGSAATLLDVVNFYDERFGIGFTAQQKTDLVNFLNAL